MANHAPHYHLTGQNLGGLQVTTCVQKTKIKDDTQLNVAFGSDVVQTDETLLEARPDLAETLDAIVDLQAKAGLQRVKVTQAECMDTVMIEKKQESDADLVRLQARYDLAKEFTTAQLDLSLVEKGAPEAYYAGRSLYSMIQMLAVNYVNHPEMVTRHVWAGCVTRANGNHRVGPSVTWLHQNGYVDYTGAGNNLQSGFNRAFARTLFLRPRFILNVELDDTSDAEAP